MRRQQSRHIHLLCTAFVLLVSACATQKEAEAPYDPEAQGVAERVRHYQGEIQKTPDNAEPHYRLGNALLDMGRYQDAFQAYQKAIELKPDYADAYANLGLTLRKLGNLKAAAGAYIRALDFNPDDPTTLGNLVVVAQLMKDLDREAWCYERLLALKPDDNGTMAYQADLLDRLGRQAEAAPLFETLAARGVDPAGSLYRAGLCYYDLQRWTEAIAAWEKARAIEPENPSINRGLAVAHLEAGNLAAARAAVARCQDLKIDLSPEFLQQLAAGGG